MFVWKTTANIMTERFKNVRDTIGTNGVVVLVANKVGAYPGAYGRFAIHRFLSGVLLEWE
jgi:hypothetical protein